MLKKCQSQCFRKQMIVTPSRSSTRFECHRVLCLSPMALTAPSWQGNIGWEQEVADARIGKISYQNDGFLIFDYWPSHQCRSLARGQCWIYLERQPRGFNFCKHKWSRWAWPRYSSASFVPFFYPCFLFSLFWGVGTFALWISPGAYILLKFNDELRFGINEDQGDSCGGIDFKIKGCTFLPFWDKENYQITTRIRDLGSPCQFPSYNTPIF